MCIRDSYYGRSNEVLSLLAAAYADITPTSTTLKWDGDKRDFVPLRPSGGAEGYKLDPTGNCLLYTSRCV